MTADREITRRDDIAWQFAWQDDQGQPIDLTDRVYQSQIRTHPDSSRAWDFDITTPDETGIVTFTMPTEVTATLVPGRLVWDVAQFTDGARVTLWSEPVVVEPEVTR